MATVRKVTGAQWILAAQFEVTAITDTMTDTSGNTTSFKATSAVYDVFTLPYGAQVVGGDLVVKTASDDTGTATVSVGDSGSATRYLGATSIKSTGRTALVPTGYAGQGEAIRVTHANQNGNATVGAYKLTVLFTIDGRQTENLKTT